MLRILEVYASARYRLPENLLRGGSLRCTAPPAAATKRYLRGGKAAQSSMIPSHMFAEHQRHQKRVPGGFACWRRGPPRRTCRLLESRKHESAKGVPPAPAAPKTGRVYANRAWILGIWCRATLLLQFLSDLYPVDYFSYKTLYNYIYNRKSDYFTVLLKHIY